MEPIKEGMNASHQYFDSGTITPDHSINIKIYLHSHILQYPPFRDMILVPLFQNCTKVFKSPRYRNHFQIGIFAHTILSFICQTKSSPVLKGK